MENKQINQDILTRRAEENVKSVQKIADINLKAVILQGQSAMKSVLLINAGGQIFEKDNSIFAKIGLRKCFG